MPLPTRQWPTSPQPNGGRSWPTWCGSALMSTRPRPTVRRRLQWAAHWNDSTTAALLIDAGAGVNAVTHTGVGALSLACENGNPAIVGLLLRAGATVNVAAVGGVTPLLHAAQSGHADVVRALLIMARNGAEALEMAATWTASIDLVITDIHMPHVDGFTLRQRVREWHPGTRCEAISRVGATLEAASRAGERW